MTLALQHLGLGCPEHLTHILLVVLEQSCSSMHLLLDCGQGQGSSILQLSQQP